MDYEGDAVSLLQSHSDNINGEIGPFFKPSRGVKQGDPMSPFLFNLVMIALATILDVARGACHLRGLCPT